MNINYDVPPPYAIQIEPVEGCSLACSFCGIQAIRENGADAELGIHGKNSAPYRYMSHETLARVVLQAAKLAWNPRWEFAMHGEPTMHGDLPGLVDIVRRGMGKDAYIMVTSNGSGLLKDPTAKIKALFAAGVNTLALDDYKHSGGWVDKIIAQFNDPLNPSWTFHRYPADPEGNPHHRHKKQKLVVINDISENSTGNHQLTNQGGNSFAKASLEERCAKPFRELSIRWDGAVALCCDDWKGEYKVGNVNSTPLLDIWYSPAFEAARRRLYMKDRKFGPCTGCDVKTSRNGLLPDKLGKSVMNETDMESEAALRTALRGKVFSIQIAKGEK